MRFKVENNVRRLVFFGWQVAICCCLIVLNAESASVPRRSTFSQKSEFDGRRLLTVQSNAVNLWDVGTGNQLQQFLGHTGHITALAFSPDGKQIVTAAAGQVGLFFKGEPVRLWDIGTGMGIRSFQMPSSELDWTFDVQFSPDGLHLLTATKSTSDLIETWEVRTGRRLFVLPKLYLPVFGLPASLSVSFSPDSDRIVQLTDRGHRVVVWDGETGKQICTIEREKEPRGLFTTVQFSPDGTQVLTTSYESRLTSERKFTPDGESFFVRGNGGAARTWDARTGQLVQVFAGHSNLVSQASFISNGREIITTSHDVSARLWDVETGKEIRRFEHPGPVEMLDVSQDGKRLITKWRLPGAPACASLWDVESGREIVQLTNRLEEVVGFSPVDAKFMVIKEGKPAALWDGATGKIIREYK